MFIENFNSGLIDWLDYPFIIWVINQSIGNISNFNIAAIFNTNAFSPFKDTLLLSDLLFPQAVLGYFLGLFSKNPIFVFNSIFIITIVLNIFSAFLLWRNFFISKVNLFFATLFTAFSPFFFIQIGHFQMISFWPFLFGLYFLFKENINARNSFLVGLFLGIQFLSSVYLSVFMLFSILIWYLLKILFSFEKRDMIINHLFVFMVTITMLCGPFLFKYQEAKQNLGVSRNYGEYIDYAAYPTDYFFNYNYASILSSSPYMSKWNDLNKHVFGESAASPGFSLIILSIIGFWIARKKMTSDFYNIYFLTLILVGFVFSLGPRLTLFEEYLKIPTPYYLFLKTLPILEVIRVTMRWSFLFYFGLVYFAILAVNGFKYKWIILMLFLTLFIIEIFPKEKVLNVENYYTEAYSSIENECNSGNKILIEYPIVENSENSTLFTQVSYQTKMLLTSVKHKCRLVNGYSGYYPKGYEAYADNLLNALDKKQQNTFFRLLKEKKVNIIKVNKENLYKDRVTTLEEWLHNPSQSTILLEDRKYLVVKLE